MNSRTIFRMTPAVWQPVRCRGSAMSEFVLVLPVLVLILMLVLFFGRGMVRAQHATMLAHYDLWQSLQPVRHVDYPDQMVVPASDGHDNALLNDLFFAGRAESIEIHHRTSFPYEAARVLVDQAGYHRLETQDIIEAVHLGSIGRRGRTVEVKVLHSEPIRLWQMFSPRMVIEQNRFGPPWSYVHGLRVEQTLMGQRWTHDPGAGGAHYGPHPLHALRDVYLSQWDEQVMAMQLGDEQNPLSGRIRTLYLSRYAYRGPEISY